MVLVTVRTLRGRAEDSRSRSARKMAFDHAFLSHMYVESLQLPTCIYITDVLRPPWSCQLDNCHSTRRGVVARKLEARRHCGPDCSDDPSLGA
jgi:hypothetical protein